MTIDPSNLTDEQIRERLQELYPLTQQPGCPKETTLEYFALSDEEYGRLAPRDLEYGCVLWDENLERELEGHLEQP